MATELELYLSAHDALSDVALSKTKSRELHHRWKEGRKVLEDQNIDSDYRLVLSIIFDKADQFFEQKNVDLENDRCVCVDKGESSRISRAATRQNIGHKHKHELRPTSVKKTNGNGADKVDNLKGLPNKGHALVNEKSFGVDDNKQGKRKLSMKWKDGASNQMTCAQNQHERHTCPTSTKNLSTEKSGNKFKEVKIEDIDENKLEGQHKDSSDSDVEILDSAAIYKEGVTGHFVPSKKFHKSMQEDGGGSSAPEEFRKEVLDVLIKPFDKEEYKRHQDAIKSYLAYHPDLQRKLTKNRSDQSKRLAIYRGFFFWLQNLTQQGSFKPWEDRECLHVKPGSG